ncbi:hypothetical protein ENTB43_213 [Enterobacter phage Entb_43]|nr:hypothetical protein ENTB43_213 [Enterobacter phage Entb_43]
MITKFTNDIGSVVYAQTDEQLCSSDFKLNSHIMIKGYFFVVAGHHIEIDGDSTTRIVIVREA